MGKGNLPTVCQTFDKIPQQLRGMMPLSENLNPINEESFSREDDMGIGLFGRSQTPFCGFD